MYACVCVCVCVCDCVSVSVIESCNLLLKGLLSCTSFSSSFLKIASAVLLLLVWGLALESFWSRTKRKLPHDQINGITVARHEHKERSHLKAS